MAGGHDFGQPHQHMSDTDTVLQPVSCSMRMSTTSCAMKTVYNPCMLQVSDPSTCYAILVGHRSKLIDMFMCTDDLLLLLLLLLVLLL